FAAFRKSSCRVALGSPCIILHLEAQFAWNIVLSSTWGSCQVGCVSECFDCALVRRLKSTVFLIFYSLEPPKMGELTAPQPRRVVHCGAVAGSPAGSSFAVVT